MIPYALAYVFKLIYIRISVHLLQGQSLDQYGSILCERIETSLYYVEIAIEHHQSFNLPLYMLSLDMRKAFDIIDHPILIWALYSRRLPEIYATTRTVRVDKDSPPQANLASKTRQKFTI